ncbi:MAG TPA: NUDIX domain-containing protein [Anaerolineales bacterium]
MDDQSFPEPTVGVFIFNHEGQLLLFQSHKWPGRFVVPGGHVELGERIEQAVVREAKEETDLEVRDLHFLVWQEFIYDPSFWKQRHFIFFDYACQADSSEVHMNDEAEAYIWIDPQKALDLPIDTYTCVSIHKYLELTGKGVSHG